MNSNTSTASPTTIDPSELCPSLKLGHHDQWYLEETQLAELAQVYGTPLYVYSANAFLNAFNAYVDATRGFGNVNICYAVKANSNIHILKRLSDAGAGFDVVSAGELQRVLAAGGKASRVVFAGVGKSETEIAYALKQGIACFNVESMAEMQRIAAVAESAQQVASVSVRVNPDVDAKTHPYISTGLKDNKFGVSMSEAPHVYAFAQQHPWLKVHGIDCHIGSQLIDASPFNDALQRVLKLIDHLESAGIVIEHIDLGGGLGIQYAHEQAPSPSSVLPPLLHSIQQWANNKGRAMPSIAFEPGRSIIGAAGLLLTRVEYLKQNEEKHFALVDAAMNDLMRPALYEAYHHIINITPKANAASPSATPIVYDIVGPVCETGDWLGKNRAMHLAQGDVLAILSAGAYGQSMASNYNSRGRAAEVLVDGNTHRLIRKRETIDDLLAPELGL